MKKMIALLTVFLMLTACSNDDNATSEEPIVGSWVLVDWNIPNIPGSDFAEEPTNCNLNSKITFEADNTATSEFYNDEGENCEVEAQSGDWESHGDGEYSIQVPGIGNQRGNLNFESNNRFTFTLAIGSMTFERA